MSQKLRDLIRQVRACKTASDERAVIAKECALIRTSFKEVDNPYRHRNVAKLLYMHMLGYPTHFGQMECVKLIASPHFPEKRIGYLGLMILLDERHQVLMLVTNSLKTDFSHKNPYIVGLSLCALGNICSADMARDLANEVEKFFRHANAYIRKKAALCAIRIIRKVPELIEEFSNGVLALLNDKNHAVLLTAVSLLIEMCKIDPKLITPFRKLVPTIVRLLKNLVLAGYVSEYDVVGIADPFLQGKLIHFLRILGTGDREASEQMNDILAQVAINTEPTKNPGNAILYECVQTIMSIEAEGGLRVLGINILGRFLTNRDNNIRYVALNTLCKCVSRDTAAVQRHRNTVVDCLKDSDISIRRRALDLIYALVTKNNVKALVKELLNYLALTSGDVEFKSDLTEKICLVVEKFAPSKQWHIETIIQVLQTAGNFTRENVATDLILLIAKTPNLQPFSVYKLFYALYKKYKHAQLPLVHVVTYAIGEYGDMLLAADGYEKAKKVHVESLPEGEQNNDTLGEGQVTENMVLELLSKIMKLPTAQVVTKQYVLNALIKLSARATSSNGDYIAKLREYIASYSTSMSVELQQRSVEYTALLAGNLDKIRSGVVARMPVPNKKKEEKKEEGNKKKEESESESDSDDDQNDDEEEDAETARRATEVPKSNGVAKKAAPAGSVDLFSMDLLGGVETSAPAPVQSKPAAAPAAAAGPIDLMDLFGSSPAPAATPAPAASQSSASLLDMFGAAPTPAPAASASSSNPLDLFGASTPASAPAASSSSAFPPQVVFSDKGLSVTFHFSHPNPAEPQVLQVKALFSNANNADLTGFDFQVAVLKNVILNLQPASSNVIPAGSKDKVQQVMTLNNTMHGKKKLVIRVKIDYNINGQHVTEQTQVSSFPE